MHRSAIHSGSRVPALRITGSAFYLLFLILHLLKHFLVRSEHTLVHFISHFCKDLLIRKKSSDEVHKDRSAAKAFREVIYSLLFVKLMVGAHHTAHLKNKVAEYLHTADAPEILRLCVTSFKCECKAGGKLVYAAVGIALIGSNTGKEVTARLRSCLNDCTKIVFRRIGSGHKISDRHTYRHGSVTVAEITVIIHLKSCAHRVILDGEGIDDGFGSLDFVSQVIVKAVGVDAFSGNGAVEAAKAAAPEGILPDVDDTGPAVKNRTEPVDHALQLGIVLFTVR